MDKALFDIRHARETTALPALFSEMQINDARQTQQQFARALGERKCERGFGRQADQAREQQITAFLEAKRVARPNKPARCAKKNPTTINEHTTITINTGSTMPTPDA